jgi:hypothetical protein
MWFFAEHDIITVPMNDNLRIEVPAHFTAEHQRLILKYLSSGRQSLSLTEWKQALNGFDLLHEAQVELEDGV